MELSFLYAIPRTQLLDTLFMIVTKIAGSYGQLWVVVGLALLIPKKAKWTWGTGLVVHLNEKDFHRLFREP